VRPTESREMCIRKPLANVSLKLEKVRAGAPPSLGPSFRGVRVRLTQRLLGGFPL
jgi:hypothetical protein